MNNHKFKIGDTVQWVRECPPEIVNIIKIHKLLPDDEYTAEVIKSNYQVAHNAIGVHYRYGQAVNYNYELAYGYQLKQEFQQE